MKLLYGSVKTTPSGAEVICSLIGIVLAFMLAAGYALGAEPLRDADPGGLQVKSRVMEWKLRQCMDGVHAQKLVSGEPTSTASLLSGMAMICGKPYFSFLTHSLRMTPDNASRYLVGIAQEQLLGIPGIRPLP